MQRLIIPYRLGNSEFTVVKASAIDLASAGSSDVYVGTRLQLYWASCSVSGSPMCGPGYSAYNDGSGIPTSNPSFSRIWSSLRRSHAGAGAQKPSTTTRTVESTTVRYRSRVNQEALIHRQASLAHQGAIDYRRRSICSRLFSRYNSKLVRMFME